MFLLSPTHSTPHPPDTKCILNTFRPFLLFIYRSLALFSWKFSLKINNYKLKQAGDVRKIPVKPFNQEPAKSSQGCAGSKYSKWWGISKN